MCWKLEGKKYDMARDLGIIVVSHRWFEDCFKEGRRIPEGPYTMKSGQEAGPISWEVPDDLDTSTTRNSLLSRERKLLAEKSIFSYHTLSPEINAPCSDAGILSWSVSSILNENCSPNRDSTIKGSEKVRKARKTSKHNYVANSRPPVTDPGLLPEASSLIMCSSSRQKRILHDVSGNNAISESARRNRRLVKKNVPSDILKDCFLDSGRENCLIESSSRINIIDSESIDLDDPKNSFTPSSLPLTSDSKHFASDGNRIQELQGTNLHNEGSEHLAEGINSCFYGMNQDEQIQEGIGPLQPADMQTQIEVSCVICWTDFSSTRGILPCGHRFCYSCIEEWADCMALKGKVSTCPLCKTSFTNILKVDDSSSPDQKIYSQTIPCGLSKTDIFMISDVSAENSGAGPSGSVCHRCHYREPEDLLLSCNICQHQWVHTYCLDPPLFPWTCIHCRDLRMLYQRFR